MVRIASKLLGLGLSDLSLGDSSSPSLLFLNAHASDNSPPEFLGSVLCHQPYRPLYVELERLGYRVESGLDSATSANYSAAFVMIDRSRDYTRHLVRAAVLSVRDGGVVFVMGEKKYGISPLRRWLSDYVDALDSTPKYHSNLLRFEVSPSTRKKFQEIETNPDAGLFGLEPDKGSSLLAGTFDSSITGSVADFCSGTGFLAERVAACSSPDSLTLIDADHRALTYSQEHCKFELPFEQHVEFLWLDLTCESPPSRYDWIVMNPPFHRGRATEPSLGRSIIRASRSCLNPGGVLRLVANSGLPYEDTLLDLFDSVGELLVSDGYKILEARV